MSSVASDTLFSSQLPWDSAAAENGRFGKITLVILLFTLLFAAYVGITDLPDIPREQKEELPPQLARIIQVQKQAPVTPPVPIEPEPLPEPEEPAPVPEVQENDLVEPQPKPEPEDKIKPVSVPEKEIPVEVSAAEKVKQARETAKSKGVLALSDTLASMRESTNLQNLANTQQTTGGGQAALTQRNTIAAPVLATSGGIQSGPVSTDMGAKGELSGRRNTEFVAASEGEASIATKRIEQKQQVIGNRELDKIRQTLDANKGAVYSLYRRALRQDPSIEGKLSVKLVIMPDGTLSSVTLIDSELDAPELVEKLIQRIRLINFGAENVSQTELEYAYNFLPY